MKTMEFQSGKNSILDVIKFDITQFFVGGYTIISTEDMAVIQIVDYEKQLPDVEFDLFDTLRLMVMFDKYLVNSDTHINATFYTKNKNISIKGIEHITNYFHHLFGVDDAKNAQWTEEDEKAIENFTFNRIWPTSNGESFIKLSYTQTKGLEFTLLFLNNLLESLGKRIPFQ